LQEITVSEQVSDLIKPDVKISQFFENGYHNMKCNNEYIRFNIQIWINVS